MILFFRRRHAADERWKHDALLLESLIQTELSLVIKVAKPVRRSTSLVLQLLCNGNERFRLVILRNQRFLS